MGFKGVENQDIKAEIKDKKVAQKILEDFMKDLPADKKEAVNKELSKLDAAHNKEMSAVKKDVAKEASDLMQEVKGYNELISGNITLEMMHNKLESIIVNAKPHEFFQETNDPTLIVLIQTALQKAGYNVKIDGNMDNDIDTSFALHDFCKKNSLDRKGGYTRVTTVKALSAYLDPSRNAVAVNIPTNVEQSQENPMIEEEKRLLDMPADKLEAAGNALFAKGDIKNATLYYKYATQKQELLKTEPFFPPITADNSRAMKAYIETNIKQYMDEANTIMTQARDSSGTYEYKKEEIEKAKTLLLQASSKHFGAWTNMLLYARRDYGNGIGKFTLGEQTKYGDIRTNRFSRNNTDLGKHYETVVDRVVLAQKLHVSLVDLEKSLKPKNKQQLIDAYVNSYFGPLTKEDVGPQGEGNSNYTYDRTFVEGVNVGSSGYDERLTSKEAEFIFPHPFFEKQLKSIIFSAGKNMAGDKDRTLLNHLQVQDSGDKIFTLDEQNQIAIKTKIMRNSLNIISDAHKNQLLTKILGNDRNWDLKKNVKHDYHKYIMLINAQLRIEQIFQKFHELRAAEIHNGVSASFTKQWEEIEANLFAW